MIHHSVAVIGAGLSGLTVAYRLMQKGIDVHVYEARQRVGGRILTAALNNTPIELGAQNILDGGKAENILKLAIDLEVETVSGKVRLYFHYHDGAKLIDIDKAINQWQTTIPWEQFRQHLKYLAQSCKNMAQVLHSLFDANPELYKLFAIRLMAYEGLPVERLSPRYAITLESMLQDFNHPDANEHKYFSYRVIEGGNAHLAEKLKEKLENRISLGAPLKTFTKTPENSYILKFDNAQMVKADRVVLTLPCSVYQDICFEGDEVLLSRLPNIKAVAYGEHAKLMVPIHIPEDVYGVYGNDRFGLFSIATPNIVTMYYLNHNTSFTPSTIQEVFRQDQLFLELIYRDKSLSHFQPVYAECKHFASYQEPVGYNWFDDPYSRGTYSCIAAGQEKVFMDMANYHGEQVKTLFYPIDDRLFFAGEHATILDVIGTMEAAVETGERVARMIVCSSYKA